MLRKDAYRAVHVQVLNVVLVVKITVHGVAYLFLFLKPELTHTVAGRPNNSELNFWQDSDFQCRWSVEPELAA